MFLVLGNISPRIFYSKKLHGRASSNGRIPKSELVSPILFQMIPHKLREIIPDRTQPSKLYLICTISKFIMHDLRVIVKTLDFLIVTSLF